MKVVIIEDEALAAEALSLLINRLRPEASILTSLGSVDEAVQWLSVHPSPDLIFCDIHLSDGDCFEIFKQVEVKSPVIFTTAYNQYAIEAFKVNSVDYLLKPIKAEELARALKKYEELQKHQVSHELTKLHNLIQTTQAHQPNTRSRFLVKAGQNMKTVPIEDVAYFMAEDGVVFLVTFPGKRFIINYTLDQLEEQLDPLQFFRANRQIIVHVKAVLEVKPYFKGRLVTQLQPETNEELIISSGKANAFKQWLDR